MHIKNDIYKEKTQIAKNINPFFNKK